MAATLRQGPPRSPGGPHDTIFSPAYLGTSPRPEPTTAFFLYIILQPLYTFTYLQMQGLCGNCVPPPQSSSTSDSLACTSIAISPGNPGSRGVKHLREQPSAVASEFDCRSSKVRCSSSSMVDPQSSDHHHPPSLGSSSASPCLSFALEDGGLGPTSSHSSPSS